MEYLAVRLAKDSGDHGGNVLIVWVISTCARRGAPWESSQKELKGFDEEFRSQKGARELRHAVVWFGEKPHLWLKPVSDVDDLAEAVAGLEAAKEGEKSNAMTALIYVANLFRSKPDKALKAAILVDDGRADDAHMAETAKKELEKSGFTLISLQEELGSVGQVVEQKRGEE